MYSSFSFIFTFEHLVENFHQVLASGRVADESWSSQAVSEKAMEPSVGRDRWVQQIELVLQVNINGKVEVMKPNLMADMASFAMRTGNDDCEPESPFGQRLGVQRRVPVQFRYYACRAIAGINVNDEQRMAESNAAGNDGVSPGGGQAFRNHDGVLHHGLHSPADSVISAGAWEQQGQHDGEDGRRCRSGVFTSVTHENGILNGLALLLCAATRLLSSLNQIYI